MRFGVVRDAHGRSLPALRAHHSAELVAADYCTIVAPDVITKAIECAESATEADVIVVAEGDDAVRVGVRADGDDPLDGPTAPRLQHRLVFDDHVVDFRVPLEGFWQADRRLVPALIEAVMELGEVEPGQHWWDLYAGAGPLAAALGIRVGAQGSVQAIEGIASAVRAARRALHAMPWVHLHQADVREWLSRHRATGAPAVKAGRVSGVVLDPPRSGAGVGVVDAIAATGARIIVYIACDPVALARDTAYLEQRGYRLTRLRAWDAFPQSHHFETVAAFEHADRIS
jgi:tRNA/tmRNA/rRNA uracil-C5-methylase (TrmA/RlmC/RlmD family)